MADLTFAVESANKVRQKTRMYTRSPLVFYALKALFLHLAQNRNNPDLMFVPFTEQDCDDAGGSPKIAGAGRIYFVYVQKENSATDNWFWVYDDDTNDGTAADAMVALKLDEANQEAMWAYPSGLIFGTGVLVTQYATDALGAVDGSNGGAGFILVSNES